MFFQKKLEKNCGWQKLEALLDITNIQLASHVDVFSTVEFSFRCDFVPTKIYICIWSIFSSKFNSFLEAPYFPRHIIIQTFYKFLLNLFS